MSTAEPGADGPQSPLQPSADGPAGADGPESPLQPGGPPEPTPPASGSLPPVPGPPADQPPPSPPDAFGGPESARMHPALQPTGEHVAHSAIGSLVGGVLVWGGVGLLLDHWLQTGRVLTAVGVVVGFLTGFFIVYVRFGRDE